MKMKRCISLLAVVFIVSNLWGQHFVFENLGIPISKRDSAQIVTMIHYQMDFYNKIYPIDSAHVRLKIFDDSTKYIIARNNTIIPVTAGIGVMSGFFSHRDSIAYVWRPHQRRNEQLPLIYHEIAHYFTHLLFPGKYQPKWLNEGLSRYFQYSERTRRKGTIHHLDSYTRRQIKTMIELKTLDLNNVMRLSHNFFLRTQTNNQSIVGTVAHGMVYFLIEENFNQFKAMVLEIKNGKSSFEAIDATYPGGFVQFEADFMNYFKK